MIVYHGSDHIIVVPVHNGSKRTNDYGYGFYTTENLELAKEWACPVKKDGYANGMSTTWLWNDDNYSNYGSIKTFHGDSANTLLKDGMSRYSLVVATAKRAREITDEAIAEKEILIEKPVTLAVADFQAEKYAIVESKDCEF